jgi:hypothetical protein
MPTYPKSPSVWPAPGWLGGPHGNAIKIRNPGNITYLSFGLARVAVAFTRCLFRLAFQRRVARPGPGLRQRCQRASSRDVAGEMASAGVFLGAPTPYQPLASYPGRKSPTVGIHICDEPSLARCSRRRVNLLSAATPAVCEYWRRAARIHRTQSIAHLVGTARPD